MSSHRANTRLVYGETGTFKTTQVGFFAAWIYRKYKKRTRLISADLGGWAPAEKYIRAGIIEPFAINGGDLKRQSALAAVKKLSRGEWPKLVNNVWRLMPSTPQEFSEIGAYAIEGLTSISDLLMEELRTRQQKIGEEAVGSFQTVYAAGDTPETYSANNRAHYNFVQNEIHSMIKSFSFLPIEEVLFTAHEGKGEDEATREPIRGPGLAGKAATGKVPTWVGDCIHADKYNAMEMVPDPSDPKKQISRISTKIRLWFVSHPDEKFPTLNYPAKVRLDAEQIPALMKRFPGGFLEPSLTHGLDLLLDEEDQLTALATEQVKKDLGMEKAA